MGKRVKEMPANLGPILHQYGLAPSRVETTGKLGKIYTERGIYALKEAELSVEERTSFVHVLERLQRIGFDRYAAPYAAKNGDPIVVHRGKTYYLMPWLKEEGPGILSKEEKLIEAGAVLHTLTKKDQLYSNEVTDTSYQNLKDRWTKRAAKLEEFAKKAEEQLYFSPFELAYLSHFGIAMKGAENADHLLKRWLELVKDEKRYRVVLCHGKLTVQHLINGDLLNFEHAVLDSPVRDLALLFRSSLMNHFQEKDAPLDWLKTYEERFPLRREEKMLLAAYLAFPETIWASVRNHQKPAANEEELIQVEKLERRVHGMINCQKLADQIMDEVSLF